MIKTMVDDLMVQQQIRAPHKKWKHMVAVMCLNLTYRKHVKIILPKLFARYPTSGEIPQGQTCDTTTYVETVGHVGSEIKKNKEDDRTVP
jgi:hypothetical protein